ncbi:virion membrane protein A16 [BeAn 58058 virus]|uniref:virion membrane protein A16 n=1 Tax=BeAn 58058 virus TaxID=67082 RepID=UPI00090AFC56|nr:virion membrane protein A16 [BeAn 58058 virus]APG58326.1 virion membrane protein A16 [BeAn 58058 virus]
MGNDVSVKSIDIYKTYKSDTKHMQIKFNYPEYNKDVRFYEDPNIYTIENDVIEPKICLLNDMDISFCGRYLSPELSKKYVLVKSKPCRSINFRPGSVILYSKDITENYLDNEIPDAAKEYISKGMLCKFVKKRLYYRR